MNVICIPRKSEADLEVWSSTDDRCYWKNAVKKFQQHVSEPISAKKFCHPKLRMSEEQSSFVPIPKSDFEKSEEYALLLTGTLLKYRALPNKFVTLTKALTN